MKNVFFKNLKRFYKEGLLATVVLVLLVLAIVAVHSFFIFSDENYFKDHLTWIHKDKVDDWQYDQPKKAGDSVRSLQKSAPGSMNFGASYSADSKESLGLSVGGSKDINNFRDNIENDYLPLTTDLTYEGLFYDYYFDTGKKEECKELFCPSYSKAVTDDSVSGEKERYLSVGLNSGIQESDFERKKLNLVIVLDISGSMGSPFNNYHYDRNKTKKENKTEENKSKMQVAAESINALTEHLNDDDRFGVVLFNNGAHLAKPLNLVGETDMNAIKNHISDISAGGGTRMSSGMKKGTELFDEVKDADKSEYENRIIFLTDAMPNMGQTGEESLLGLTRGNAEEDLYSTFIGIGVDFNTELTEAITKIEGANYYSVHSNKDFKERMDEQFEYMVTPLVFDLELTLNADGYEIEKVYGSPEADESTGEIMKVNTLFPSPTKEGKTKGGLVLLKLKKASEDAKLDLKVSYEDREGEKFESTENIKFEAKNEEYFENKGLRKGILLASYADLMKNWIRDERVSEAESRPVEPRINERHGIIIPEPVPKELSKWERQSVPLQVSGEYKELFEKFKKHFDQEMDKLGDETLEKERKIIDKLIKYN